MARLSTKIPSEAAAATHDLRRALSLDVLQLSLDIAGIFDPTPISDGASALLSVARGDFLGGALSAIGMVPYIGDLGKLGKLRKYQRSFEKAIDLAKRDADFALQLRPALVKLQEVLKSIPLGSLPKRVQTELRDLMKTIDRAFDAHTPLKYGFKPFADCPSFAGKSTKDILRWLDKSGFDQQVRVIDGAPVRGPILDAAGRTKNSDVYVRRRGEYFEVVRVDARGNYVNTAKLNDVPLKQYRLTSVPMAWGQRRHFHKEVIHHSDLKKYLNHPIGKKLTAAYDDTNNLTSSMALKHIELEP